MIDEVLTLMTNGSPMVAFAVYLIWSNNRSEKRLDEVNSNYNEKLDNILLPYMLLLLGSYKLKIL